MQNLPKNILKFWEKYQVKRLMCIKAKLFSLVHGLTQRHQTTVVSAATAPGDSASCSNHSVMAVILVRSTTSQFLTELYPAFMIYGTCLQVLIWGKGAFRQWRQLWGGMRDHLGGAFPPLSPHGRCLQWGCSVVNHWLSTKTCSRSISVGLMLSCKFINNPYGWDLLWGSLLW